MDKVFVTAIISRTIEAQDHIGLPVTLTIWCILEIIRYNYQAFNLLGSMPRFLPSLRAKANLVLIPIGLVTKMMCLYWACEHVNKETDLLPILSTSIVGLMFSQIVLFVPMYAHLVDSREMVISSKINGKITVH